MAFLHRLRFLYTWLLTPSGIAVALVGLLLNNWFNVDPYTRDNSIRGDGISYYAYLPAVFVHNDLRLTFMNDTTVNWSATYWPTKGPNGERVIKTTCGMAVAYLPFFLYAHAKATAHPDQFTPDGFSAPYQTALYVFGIIVAIIGLLYLRALLLLFFSQWAVTFTLLAIAVGTNFFPYSTIDAFMSHGMGFLLLAALLYHYFKWEEKPRWHHALAIGLAFGWATLIRPVNGLFILLPLFHFALAPGGRERLGKLMQHLPHVLYLAAGALLFIALQLAYWKHVTGQWVFFSYSGERFWWQYPHVLDGLFSYRKGLLLYAPVMVFGFLGLWQLHRQPRGLGLPVMLFLAIYMYVIFSWWAWWYGGSFGMRAMIDVYPALALGMAAFLHWVFGLKIRARVPVGIATVLVVGVLAWYGWFKVWQQRNWLVHWDGNTKESYWQVFLVHKGVPGLDTTFVSPDYEGRLHTGIENGTGY